MAAAGPWTFTDIGRISLLNGTFDLDSDSLKIGLALSTSNIGPASTTFAGVTNPHATANGYPAGGVAVAGTLSGTGVVTFDCADAVFTAVGGPITARYAILYEVGGNVIAYCLLDSTPADVTATDGNTLTVQISATGVFTLT